MLIWWLIFSHLDREEVNSEDLKEIKEPKDLLDFLDGKYFVYNNLIYLQGLFLACKAPELYDECVKYAKHRGEEIHFFEKGVLENGTCLQKNSVQKLQIYLIQIKPYHCFKAIGLIDNSLRCLTTPWYSFSNQQKIAWLW